MPTKISKNKVSVKKIQRYKELKAQQAIIDNELKELRQYFISKLNSLGFDDILVDEYRIKRSFYDHESLKADKLKEEYAEIYYKFLQVSDVERLTVK